MQNNIWLGVGAGRPGKTMLVKNSTDLDFAILRDIYRFSVDPVNGDALIFSTVQQAVNACRDGLGDYVQVAPGAYNETVTIPATVSNLTIEGLGGRGAAYIDPSTEDVAGMVCHADDVTLKNLGVAAEDETSATALTVTGTRFRAYDCKIEGGANQLVIGPGTAALITAGSKGKGADSLFKNCEFAWGTNGVILQGTDYGGATQNFFEGCHFHNLTTKHITEAVGSGGSAAVTFFNLLVKDCTFDNLEDGTAPTNFIDLNANNANTGVVTGCRFPVAINSGLNLVSTKVIWTGNYMTGGISAAQPS